MPAEPDVVVVGAGAAGVAAARTLLDRGFQVVVLEARNRVGGRAWTADLGGHPADMGCAWLHSGDRNPWTPIAEELGLQVERTPPRWGRRFARERQLGEDEAARKEAAFERFFGLVEDHRGPDRSFADILPADDPWLPAFAAVMSYISGGELPHLSVLDYARYADSGVNWRVPAGYGRLVETYAAGLPVTLEAPVLAIDWGGLRVAVTSPKGTLSCRAVVLTIPPSLLVEDSIAFTPDLPLAKFTAAAGLPLGNAAKLLLAVEGDPFGLNPDRQAIGDPRVRRTGLYQLRLLGRPLVEAFWGGALALELERAGPAAMADFALGELIGIFGAQVRAHLRPLLGTDWSGDPYSRGAYSYARPGGADGRAVLAEPLDGRLFFAGEACSTESFSTAHGAYETGLAAADQVARALRAASR